jgi:hypothetical protein
MENVTATKTQVASPSTTTTTAAPVPAPAALPFETFETNLAAFLMISGQRVTDVVLRGTQAFYIFQDAPACEKLEKEYRFGDPSIKLREFVRALSTCRDFRKALEARLK